jgi:hypothetical protein
MCQGKMACIDGCLSGVPHFENPLIRHKVLQKYIGYDTQKFILNHLVLNGLLK